jgi:hypothetical protein
VSDQAYSLLTQKRRHSLPPAPPDGGTVLHDRSQVLQIAHHLCLTSTGNHLCYLGQLKIPSTEPSQLHPRLSARKKGSPPRQISTTEGILRIAQHKPYPGRKPWLSEDAGGCREGARGERCAAGCSRGEREEVEQQAYGRQAVSVCVMVDY